MYMKSTPLLKKKIYIVNKDKELVYKQIFLSLVILWSLLIFLSSLFFPTPFRLSFERLYGSFLHPNRLVVWNSASTFTLTDEAKVRRLYEEIYALPTFPYRGLFPYRGPISCPMESRPTYNLDFYVNNARISHGEYLPFGCGVSVKLNGIFGRNDTGNSFGNDLVQALVIPAVVFYGYHKPLEAAIYLTQYGFSPNKVKINVGVTTVRWENTTGEEWYLKSDDYAMQQALKDFNSVSPIYTHTFIQPGIYSFYNQIRPDQKGTIIVTK